MKELEQHISINFKNALKDPSLAHFHEAILSVQNRDNRDILPKKYEKSMTNLSVSDTVKFFKEDPNMSIKTVVATILQSFPEDISAVIVLKMTKKIVNTWQSLSTSLHIDKQTAIAA